MTVYTVSSADGVMSEPLDTLVAGTYTTRGRAVDECAAYIMERLGNRQDLARSMLNDENHPEARKFLVGRKDGTVGVRKGCLGKLKAFVRDELGGTGCYYVYDGDSTWHFDVDENDLCGDAWLLVTWGVCDHENPEFCVPFPKLFTDEDKAVANAIRYACDLMGRHDVPVKGMDAFVIYAQRSLRDAGQARLDLDDGTAVCWVLYHFGMETDNTDARGTEEKVQGRVHRNGTP